MKKTVKKGITVFLAVFLLLAIFTVNVFADEKEPVEFKAYIWSENELLSTVMEELYYFELTSDTNTFESNETYVVRGSVTVPNRIECGQNVKLVLTDGSELCAEKGIHVRGSLEIFGGTENTGTLVSNLTKSENGFSSIGINTGDTSCSVTVHGGQIKLRHDGNDPCINAGSGDFTLYRGNVEARSYDGNGITAGTITVCDGNLLGTSAFSAGISGNTVTIYGGEMNFEGVYGAGIEGKDITINGGIIEAESSSGAGIGSGTVKKTFKGITSCNSITINDGNISTSSYTGASIGSGQDGSCGTITINGGRIMPEMSYGGALGSGVGGSCSLVNINGGLVINFNLFDTGYAFRGEAGFGSKAGKMPDIKLGKGVKVVYRDSFIYSEPEERYVTSDSKNIKETLQDRRSIAVLPKEQDEMRNGGTGSFFSSGSSAILISCMTLLLGGAAGFLMGRRYWHKDSND